VVHVGDSRCYILRQSSLERVTTDHTVEQHVLDAGAASPDEPKARRSTMSHVLWNALGGSNGDVYAAVYRATLELGDTVLLATDGLTRHLTEEAIGAILTSETSARATCRRLIDAANEAGGEDNVTAVVARFRGPARDSVRTRSLERAEETAERPLPGTGSDGDEQKPEVTPLET
jgi:protein phosphatase